jgi:acetyltransferase-like isoleucine patch superfamily enzyme
VERHIGIFQIKEELFLMVQPPSEKEHKLLWGGVLEFGNHFFCNANCILNAGDHIFFGDDVLLGWNCTIIDGDGHGIISECEKSSRHEPIEIGKHVWLASGATILKGSKIRDGSCVAANGCITKKFTDCNLLLGGFNKVLRKNIEWVR